MFVFKAAVVGAGTMGGEIAQVLASADVDVVLKDVDQKFVDTGLEKAKQVTDAQVGRLVKKEKITQEQGDEQVAGVLGRIHGTTDYEGFAQQIRKTPIRCGEAPGFVVNRILNSATSEIWKAVTDEGLDVKDVDKVIQESGTVPMGPFFLTDLLGLDTVLHVAEHLQESYGDRFYVMPQMKELVEAGDLGQKTGKGFYEHGN